MYTSYMKIYLSKVECSLVFFYHLGTKKTSVTKGVTVFKEIIQIAYFLLFLVKTKRFI